MIGYPKGSHCCCSSQSTLFNSASNNLNGEPSPPTAFHSPTFLSALAVVAYPLAASYAGKGFRSNVRVKDPKRQRLFATEAGRLEFAQVTSGHEGGRYLQYWYSTPLLHFIIIKASLEIQRVRIAVELARSRQGRGRTGMRKYLNTRCFTAVMTLASSMHLSILDQREQSIDE